MASRGAELALREVSSSYEGRRAPHLARLVAPMDDMWSTFADLASQHALSVGGRTVGSCAVDAERRLLRFEVEPRCAHHAGGLLRLAASELAVERLMVPTLDPGFLGPALDVAARVEVHTLLFAPEAEPEVAGSADLRLAPPGDRGRIVDFELDELGADRSFLESYVELRLGRQELLLQEDADGIVAVGELRRDPYQAGIAHLGVIVRRASRGQGIASRLLAALMARSRAEGLAPHCSTEVANLAARRAIERAGFRARHRLLSVTT